jgi:hypothetical protein
MLISNEWAKADETLLAMRRDEADFRISQAQHAPRQRADLLQTVPG